MGPASRAFFWRIVGINAKTSLPGVSLMSLYLHSLYDLPLGEWHTFLGLTALWTAVLFTAAQLAVYFVSGPLTDWLEKRRLGAPGPAEPRAAFRTVVDLPRIELLVGCPTWLVGAVGLGAHASLLCPHFRLFHAGALFGACVSSGLLSMLFAAFLTKREFTPLREELAREVGDVEAREAESRPISLSWKLGLIAAAAALVPSVFAALIIHGRASGPVEALVLRLQHERLAELAERWDTAEGGGLGGRRSEEADRATLGRLSIVPLGSRGRSRVSGAGLSTAEWDWLQRAQRPEGNGRGLASEHLFSWRRLPGDERVAVLALPWSAVSSELGGLERTFFIVVTIATALALFLVRLAARDLHHSTSALLEQAERIAAGDLSPSGTIESEDELGALGHAFERMANALRLEVGRVRGAAEGVGGAARQMETVGSRVAGVTAGQVRGLAEISEAVSGIDDRVRGISESAHTLSATVERSSGAVGELSQAAQVLREVAHGLSSRMEETGTSIDRMTQSVSEIEAHTESLSDAGAETSSNMQEMARSSAQVGATAEEAEQLSSQVTEAAEAGLLKVRRAIDGMGLIGSVTESAREVIQGLGQHVGEIGAIVDVINSVADETQLLSLNASIIAAQAGEEGRAFSVVAEAIRDLADRVLASTHGIEERVRLVQRESTHAIGAVRRGVEAVAAGNRLVAEAGDSLEAITQTARHSGIRMQEIVGAVCEQAKSSQHVAQLMEGVTSRVERIHAAIEQHARGSEGVRQGSASLRELAQQVHHATREHARSATQIEAGVGAVLAEADRIGAVLREQSAACERAAGLVERIYTHTRSNEQTVDQMTEATRTLRAQAEELRRDVERFRL